MAYRLVHQEITAEGETYTGESEICSVEYEGETTPQKLADATKQAVSDEGGTLLSVSIWQDGHKWRTRTVAHGSPLPWMLIIQIVVIIAAVTLLLVFGVIPVTKTSMEILRGPFGSASGGGLNIGSLIWGLIICAVIGLILYFIIRRTGIPAAIKGG